MPGIARQGDTTSGICDKGLLCCPHSRTGTDAVCSPNVFANGLAVHRQNDTGPTNCPHGGTFQSVAGSDTVFVNGQPVTRIGDTTTCMSCGKSGSHASGSSNVFVGG